MFNNAPTQQGIPQYEPRPQRQAALTTPITFSEAVTTNTSLYAGKINEFFLLRKLAVANTTASPLSLTITVGTDAWVSAQSIPANTTVNIDGLEGQMFTDNINVTGTGSGAGLNVFGWGLRIQAGGEQWRL